MDLTCASLSPSRAETSRLLCAALGSSGRHWSSVISDCWTYPPVADEPWSYPASDPEFSNASSPETISSSSSVIDYLSPESAMTGHDSAQTGHVGLEKRSSPSPQAASSSSSSSSSEETCSPSNSSSVGGVRSKRRTRSRNPSRQRQCASEKEKLRMRDLTKALHHLRTYLPPSVAPAGQTLTKIQTLRLAIRYIAHLSAQVEDREESLPQARTGQESHLAAQVCFPQQWRQGEGVTWGRDWGSLAQPSGGTNTKQGPWRGSLEIPAHYAPYDSTYEHMFSSSMDSLLQSPAHTTEAKQSYQEYDRDMPFHTIAPEYWI